MSKVIEINEPVIKEQVKEAKADIGRAEPAATPLNIGLALLAVYVIWGSTYLAIRYMVVGGIPPLLGSGVRFLIAGGGLYLFLRWRGAANPTLNEWRGAAIMGALLLGTGNGFVALAEQDVASGLAALAVATVPLWTTLFARIWGYRSTGLEWAGIAVGFVGIIILNFGGNMTATPLGAILLIIAPISWALGTAWGRKLILPPGLMFSAAEMLTGGGVLVVMGLLHGEWLTRTPEASAIWGWLFLVIVGSLLGFTAFNYLLRHTRPALATSYAYVNPAVAVLLGAVIAGEAVTTATLIAMPVILAGVALVVFAKGKGEEKKAEG